MLLIFAVFMGCLLTKATLSHLVILALFYIPVSGQLHPLSYTLVICGQQTCFLAGI